MTASALPRHGLNHPAGSDTISLPVLAGLIRVMDLCLLALAGFVASLATSWFYGHFPTGPIVLAGLAGAVASSLVLQREHAYRQSSLLSISTELRLLIKLIVLGTCGVIACLFLLNDGAFPERAWPIVWAFCATGLLALSRVPIARQLRRWTGAGRLARKVAIVGLGDFSREFIQRLAEEPNSYQIVGIFDDRITRTPPSQLGIEVLGTVSDLLQRSREERIDVIVVALPLSAVERIKVIMDQLGSAVADIVLTTDLAGLRFSRTQFGGMGNNPVVTVREAPLKDWSALQKTVLDYGIGVLALVLLSPVLLLTAAAIRLDTPGPILFRQPRMGFNNRLFLCYKFRSMHHRMADMLADQQTTRHDPRVTRVGRSSASCRWTSCPNCSMC